VNHSLFKDDTKVTLFVRFFRLFIIQRPSIVRVVVYANEKRKSE